jgi:hypothetical protein
MKKNNILKLSGFLISFSIIYSCSPPKSVINSGKVVTKNQVRFGNDYSVNVSTSPINETIKGVKEFSQLYENKDSFQFDKSIEHINAAALAYCLDPIGYKTDLYLRYGLGHNIDLGYRYSGKAHVVDARYQFLGSNSTYQYSDYKGLYGSIGLQYGWQKYSFDGKFEQLKRIFDMSMSRKDISIPVIFSKGFGPEEKFGAISFGVSYTHSFIKYNVNPVNVYARDNEGIQRLMEPLNNKNSYSSYGSFMNLKAGYKFIYFNIGLAAYYQNYGIFPLLGGTHVKLEGWTFVPSYGLQFNLYPRKKKTELRHM